MVGILVPTVLVYAVGLISIIQAQAQDITFRPEDLNITEADCKSGYVTGPDCCTYYQCTGFGRGRGGSVRLTQRSCVFPLVWNKEICACDWSYNVPGCGEDTLACPGLVVPPTVGDCPLPEHLNISSECCINGVIYEIVDTNDLTKYKVRGEDEIGECPPKYEFIVSSCCCEHTGGEFGEQTCLVWNFQNGLHDINQNVAGFTQGATLVPGAGSGPHGGNALKFDSPDDTFTIPAFQKGFYGLQFSIGVGFQGGTEGGKLFHNGGTVLMELSEDGSRIRGGVSSVLGDTINDFDVPINGGRRRKRAYAGSPFESACWLYGSLDFYINQQLVASPEQPSAPVQGTGCPLTIGGNFTGLIDLFFFCPFEITAEEIDSIYEQGIYPTRSGGKIDAPERE